MIQAALYIKRHHHFLLSLSHTPSIHWHRPPTQINSIINTSSNMPENSSGQSEIIPKPRTMSSNQAEKNSSWVRSSTQTWHNVFSSIGRDNIIQSSMRLNCSQRFICIKIVHGLEKVIRPHDFRRGAVKDARALLANNSGYRLFISNQPLLRMIGRSSVSIKIRAIQCLEQ